LDRLKKFRGRRTAAAFFAVVFFFPARGQQPDPKKEEAMLKSVHWLGHAAVQIAGSKVVYVDPFRIQTSKTADLILITHDHHDHLSPDDIKKIQGPQTVIITPVNVTGLSGIIKKIKPGDSLDVSGIRIRAVPAYNLNKPFHPKEKGNVGYVFTTDGVTYYHAGDTDFIPEMKGIQPDVAFLPVGGTYTMTPEEAAKAAEAIGPKIAVPIHWGSIVGSIKDAEDFKRLCVCPVKILTAE
jgi:L-ascorbate metabolism protein UlaG (beta-lactamase superfamily)